MRLNRDDTDKFFDYGIHQGTKTLYVGSWRIDEELESGVDAKMAEMLIKGLHILDNLDSATKPIHILMNNPGGDYFHGLAMFDAIRNCKSQVTITVFGYAMSMGCVVLQAADTRIVSPNAHLMIHYGHMGFAEDHPKVTEQWVQANRKAREWMEELFYRRMTEKQKGLKKDDVKKMLDFDTIFYGKAAVDAGLADKVLPA